MMMVLWLQWAGSEVICVRSNSGSSSSDGRCESSWDVKTLPCLTHFLALSWCPVSPVVSCELFLVRPGQRVLAANESETGFGLWPVHLVTVTTSSTGCVRTVKSGMDESSGGCFFLLLLSYCSSNWRPVRRSVNWRVEVSNRNPPPPHHLWNKCLLKLATYSSVCYVLAQPRLWCSFQATVRILVSLENLRCPLVPSMSSKLVGKESK